MVSINTKNNMTTRATCLNCIDGRVQSPILDWIRKQYNIDFVDVITAAGMNRVLASQDNIDEIIHSINISVNVNRSVRIFIVGHYDCQGNLVNEKTHQEHIATSVNRLKPYRPDLEIIGLLG